MVTSGSSLASRLSALLGAVCLLSPLAACVRDPLTGSCPDLAEGELVITEVSLGDVGAPHGWIEVFNATDRTLDLDSLRVTMTPLTGDLDKTRAFIVRDELEVPAGAYAVLGQGDPRFYDFIDYDFVDDQGSDLEASATYELHACDVAVDHATVRALGFDQSLGLGGPPDADANDDSKSGWCPDTTVHQSAPDKQSTHGSPGEANPQCPA